jgi:plasmid stability protein
MGAIHIRNVKDSIKEQLRIRAAKHGRSMEEEVRCILEQATTEKRSEEHLFHRMQRLAKKYGPMDIDLPPRELLNDPPDFSRWPKR